MSTSINIKKQIAAYEEGSQISSDISGIDITGDGASASMVGSKMVINVPGGIGNITYYLNQTVTQAPYKEFSSIPTAAAEQTISNTVAGNTTITVQSFQTASGVPGTTNIPGGLWLFYLHFSGTLGHNWDIYVEVYKRNLGGIETLLLTTDTTPVSTLSGTPTMILTEGVFPASTVLTTDRIVVKVKVRNTDSNSNNITFHTEGSTNYSVATTTLNQTVPTGAVASVSGTAPVVSSGGTTPAISMPQATGLVDGYLDSADFATFSAKQDPITLTTTGTTGAATFIANILNIPQYQGSLTLTTTGSSGAATLIANALNIPNYTLAGLGGVPTSRTLTINGVAQDLSADRTWSVGTVTSVTGTAPIVSSGGATPAISIPQATALTDGYLTAADWSTFNGKQDPITLTTTGSSGAATLIGNTLNIPNYSFTDTNIYNSDGTLTGNRTLTYTGNRLLFTGTNSSTTLTLDMKASAGSGNRYARLRSVLGTQTTEVSVTAGNSVLSNQDSSSLVTTQVSAGSDARLSYSDGSSTIVNGIVVDSLVTLTYSDSINITQLTIGSNGYNFNGAYILPKVAGTNGQVLTTDGVGNVTWQSNGSGTVTSVGLTTGTTGTDVNVSGSPITGSGSFTLNIPTASATNRGALSSADWTTFNNKGNGTVTSVAAITLGTSGLDLNSSVATGTTTPVITLNVPTASAINRGVLSPVDWVIFNAKQTLLVSGVNIKTVNSTSILGSGDLAVGTVTNVSALTIGTTGTDITSTVATGTTTPVITLNVPTASATNRGALSSTDWSTFNGKQNAITLTTTGTSGAATLIGSTLNIPQYSGGGSSTWNVTTQSGASYTAASNDYVLINAASHIVTLPAASNGIRVGVKMINATVTSIQIKTPSAGITIDGVDRSVTGLGIFNQYDAYTFVSDGTNWFIMG